MRKILIVHTWGIGDWLFFSPVIKALEDNFPQIHIDVLIGTPGTRSIVDFYKDIHIKGVSDVRRRKWGMIKLAIKTWPTKYDALIFTVGIDSQKADKYASLIGAQKKIALLTTSNQPRFINLFEKYDYSIHRVENNLKLLHLLGLKFPRKIQIYLPIVNSLSYPIPGSVLIHPGSGKSQSFKRWPINNFLALVKQLLGQNRRVSVILGPEESELLREFSILESNSNFTIYQNLTLLDTTKIIANHEIFLNSDSGLGHLAAALGRRTVTIFGPGDPIQVRPYSDNAVIVKTNYPLDCMPCLRPGGLHGCKNQYCLKYISVEEVLEKI